MTVTVVSAYVHYPAVHYSIAPLSAGLNSLRVWKPLKDDFSKPASPGTPSLLLIQLAIHAIM